MSCSIFNFNKKTNKESEVKYMGSKNKTSFPEFIRLCKLSAKQLKNDLLLSMYNYYDSSKIITGDGFIYVKGDIPILLTAHMDTVHKELIKDFYEDKKNGKHILSSPQGIGGDDRCGIYMITQILKTSSLRPYILFCEDEEIGGIGSGKFCKTEYAEEVEFLGLKYMIELDRANAYDAVYYDCGNEEFQKYIENTTGYSKAHGSFSDICNLSETSDIASVNLSCGYYNAHTTAEYVVVEEMLNTMQTVKDLLTMCTEDLVQFDYQCVYNGYTDKFMSKYGYYGYGYGYGYGYEYDDYKYNTTAKKVDRPVTTYYISAIVNGIDDMLYSEGDTIAEAWWNLFKSYPSVCYNDILDFDIMCD